MTKVIETVAIQNDLSGGSAAADGAGLSRKPRRRAGWWVRRIAIVLIAIPLFAWALFTAAVWWWPYPVGIDHPPIPGTWIEDRNGRALAAFVGPDDQWHLPLAQAQISPHLLHAIVAVEDSRFYQHHGVDWQASFAAAWQDLTALHIQRGASTITMQVHRLRDPRPRTFWNKFEQAVRARQIETQSGKDGILVEYLNRAPFGGNLVGVGAASWRYFGRPCLQLSLGEAALLAGLPQSPNRFRPDRFPQRARQRRDHVLARMLACGWIDQTQHDEAMAEPIDAQWRLLPQMENAAAAMSAATIASMPTYVGLSRRYPGQAITTTLDAAIQRQTTTAAKAHLGSLESSGVSAIAVVVVDTLSGECLASVSISQIAEKVDLAQRPRSTGSTLKPFIYAAAFDAGICTPATVLNDSPTVWPGYAPANYDHDFRGRLTAGEALAESRNLPAMVVLGQVGIDRAVSVCQAMGLHTLARAAHPYGMSLAIGGAEASPLELATAYATLARGGIYKPVTFTHGEQIAGEPRAIRYESCQLTLAALSEASRTARVCAEAVPLHVAWKTGTSSGHRDAWCAAVTPRKTVIVWLGNAGGEGAAALIGAEAAAPLALRLIASLDRSGETWSFPPLPRVAGSSAKPLSTWARSPLVIVSPARGQEVMLTPDLPADQQQIALRGVSDGSEPELWWFIDGQPSGTSKGGDTIWWSPTIGSHQVRLVDSAGHSSAVQIRVREP